MIEDPTAFFSDELNAGKVLCLLPMDRVHAEEPVWLSQEMVFYPPNSLNSSSLRVVWEPKLEWDAFLARNHAKTPGVAQAEGDELHWIKSAATNVTADDLLQGGLLAFPIEVDWNSFLSPESHEALLELIATVAAHVEKHFNRIRFDCCRIDVPEALPERAGLLRSKQFSAALFYTQQDHESCIIAGDLVRQRFVTGIGLKIDGVSTRPFSTGEAENIVIHALQMHTDALEAPNDTAKFINLMNLLDYLADPSDYVSMVKAKGRLARHIAKTRSEYDEIIEDLKLLTSKRDPSNRNIGLRHNIIHIGQRLEQLLEASERQTVLVRMSRYASKVIEDLLSVSGGSWMEVEQMREVNGRNLGIVQD